MKHTAQYITLESVILDYISQANLTEAAYFRLWNIAVRGLERMGLSYGNEPVTRKLTVMPNKTVELPNDYLSWNKVGVINDAGEIATLLRNPNLSKFASIDADRVSLNTGTYNTIEQDDLFLNFWHEDTFYNLFGVNSGTDELGQFDIDEVQGVILLDKDYKYDHVILEYMSSPAANGDYKIKMVLREPLVAWIAWQDISNLPASRRSNANMVALRRQEYYRLFESTKKYVNPMRLSEANDIIRSGQKLAVKH